MYWIQKRDYREEPKVELETPYVRIHPRAVYLSAAIAERFDGDAVIFGLDSAKRIFVLCPDSSGRGFKLSLPDASYRPRRIETANICIDFLNAGFPVDKLGKYLPAAIDEYGFIRVEY